MYGGCALLPHNLNKYPINQAFHHFLNAIASSVIKAPPEGGGGGTPYVRKRNSEFSQQESNLRHSDHSFIHQA